MMPAPPRPWTARATMSCVGSVAKAASGRGEREDRDADDEDGAAAEAVAERDREEDEAREDQRVRVDEPLQLFDGGAAAPCGAPGARWSSRGCRGSP